MSDRVESLLEDLSHAPVVSPTRQAVLHRGQQRRRRARAATALAVIALVAAGTTTGVALQRQLDKTADQRIAAPGAVGTIGSPAGYPASFLASRGGPDDKSIAQYDGATGAFQTSLTPPDTWSATIADGNLYYLKGTAGCATLWKQPLAGGVAERVSTGAAKGVDRLASDGRKRLSWVGCLKTGVSQTPWGDKVLHIEDVGGGAAQDVKLDVPEFAPDTLSVGADGRIVVGGTIVRTNKTVEPNLQASSTEELWYVVDPARTDRLSGGQKFAAAPAGCAFTQSRWHGADLIAALSCVRGNPANGTGYTDMSLVTISGQTLAMRGKIADLGRGSVFYLAVARDGAVLVVMGDGAGMGPVRRVIDAVVTELPQAPYCTVGKCPLAFEEPVWLE